MRTTAPIAALLTFAMHRGRCLPKHGDIAPAIKADEVAHRVANDHAKRELARALGADPFGKAMRWRLE